MSDNKTSPTGVSELKTTGVLLEKGVRIDEKSSIDALSQCGYGTAENDVFTLTFYEALYLVDKELLEVKDKNGKELAFQSLLQCYEKANERKVGIVKARPLTSTNNKSHLVALRGTDFLINHTELFLKTSTEDSIWSTFT